MTIESLDFAFPFVVLTYGAIMTLVLHSEALMRLAESRLSPQIQAQFQSHRVLGLICLIVGSLWSFQNIWSTTAL